MTSAAMTPEQERELREWVVSRPTSIQDVMRKFPPGCTVRATVALGIPAPGCIGQVVSYIEPGKDGRAGVRVHGRWNGIGPFMGAHCNADELELVEEGIVTREQIDAILR
jgi:hypothetical protein